MCRMGRAMTSPVRSMLHIQPLPGRRDDVIAYYRDHRIIELAVERGLCTHGELIVPADEAAALVVTCTWPSRAHYAAWADARPASVEGLKDLLHLPRGTLAAGELFDIVIDTAQDRAEETYV